MEGLSVPFNAIAQGLESVFQAVQNIGSDVAGAVSGFFTDLKNGVVNAVKSVFDTLVAVKDFIVTIPDRFVDIWKSVWIPKDGFFTDLYGGIIDDLKAKIPAIEQIQGIWDTFYNSISNATSEKPSFNITYQGKTLSIIDFDMYDQYRSFVHGIILCIAYYLFAIKVIKRLPTFIGGLSSDS